MTRFTRCTLTRSDGARCWLAPGHDGKHLVLPPGAVPTGPQIDAIGKARPDLDYGAVCLMAALEPVGKLTPEGAAEAKRFMRETGFLR